MHDSLDLEGLQEIEDALDVDAGRGDELLGKGFADVSDLLGGYGAWSAVHEIAPVACEATQRAEAAAKEAAARA